MKELFFRAGDQIPFRLLVRRAGIPLDISGYRVFFLFHSGSGPEMAQEATLSDAANGQAEFWTREGDLLPGDLSWEWAIIDPQGRPAGGPATGQRKATVNPRLAPIPSGSADAAAWLLQAMSDAWDPLPPWPAVGSLSTSDFLLAMGVLG